jgi:hypothetical protein
LKSHQQWRSVPLSPHPHLLSPEFFDLSHSDLCKVEFQGCFDLHFPDDYGCWTFFLGGSQPFGIPQLRSLYLCTPFLTGLFGFLESNFLSSL